MCECNSCGRRRCDHNRSKGQFKPGGETQLHSFSLLQDIVLDTYSFLRLHSTTHILTMRAHSFLRIHVRKLYPYKHLRWLSWRILEIDEVTIDISLSMEISPTTESIPLILEYSLLQESNPRSEMLPRLL